MTERYIMEYNMKKLESFRLVEEFAPSKENPRNSEGDFIRGRDGKIYFAYSRYKAETGKYAQDGSNDHAACDIYITSSSDEGESWSEPTLLASAENDFGVHNIMSVSALRQQNGECAFYFMIKENDGTATLGRAFFELIKQFVSECNAGVMFSCIVYVICKVQNFVKNTHISASGRMTGNCVDYFGRNKIRKTLLRHFRTAELMQRLFRHNVVTG